MSKHTFSRSGVLFFPFTCFAPIPPMPPRFRVSFHLHRYSVLFMCWNYWVETVYLSVELCLCVYAARYLKGKITWNECAAERTSCEDFDSQFRLCTWNMHTEYTKETRNVSKINKSSWNSSLVLIALRRTGTYMISVSANIHHHMKMLRIEYLPVFCIFFVMLYSISSSSTHNPNPTDTNANPWRSTFREFLVKQRNGDGQSDSTHWFLSKCLSITINSVRFAHSFYIVSIPCILITMFDMESSFPSFHLIFYVISLQAMEIRPAKIYWQIWLMEKGLSYLNIFTHNSVNNTKMI